MSGTNGTISQEPAWQEEAGALPGVPGQGESGSGRLLGYSREGLTRQQRRRGWDAKFVRALARAHAHCLLLSIHREAAQAAQK